MSTGSSAVDAGLVLTASCQYSLGAFVPAFVLVFIFSGLGNGSGYEMIPILSASEPENRAACGVGLPDGSAGRPR